MDQRNENRGRDQNIFNQPGTVVINPSQEPERSRTEQQLLQIVKEEVESRLRQSLHNAVLINLDKEAQPNQVKRPWDAEVKIGAKPAEPIPENTDILEVFDRPDLGGKLLILGNPGSGKTTTLLDLAKALIERAETDVNFPIPVLFNLSAWKEDKQRIRDWLIAELKQKYGVRAELGERWLKHRSLLPLLDGLDEVKPERQEACVRAINTFLTGEDAPLYAVVCSRREEYKTYKTSLQLNGAICLQALTLPQIQDYLAQVNRPELWDLLNQDAALLELVQAPLFLSVVSLAYPQDSLDDWQQLNSREERLQDLWNRYICRMFERELRNNPYRKKTPSQKQSRRWLIWLAQQIDYESQTEFLIEEMQPSWLGTYEQRSSYKWIYTLSIGIIVGLVAGLSSGLKQEIVSDVFDILSYESSFTRDSGLELYDGLLSGVLSNLFVGLFYGLSSGLFGIAIRELYSKLSEAAIFGLVVGLSAGLSYFSSIYSPIIGLIAGLIGMVIGGLIDRPNEDIDPVETLKWSWNRAFFGLLLILLETLLFGLIGGLIGWIIGDLILSLFAGLIVGLTNGLISALVYTLWDTFGDLLYLLNLEKRYYPNQAIFKSATSAMVFWLIGVVVSALVIGLSGLALAIGDGLIVGLLVGLILGLGGLSRGLLVGLIVGLRYGGAACIQHITLRIVLFRSGVAPWNYARFLDYASERLLIQRVGGRYRFIHKLLQDHFAAMPLD